LSAISFNARHGALWKHALAREVLKTEGRPIRARPAGISRLYEAEIRKRDQVQLSQQT